MDLCDCLQRDVSLLTVVLHPATCRAKMPRGPQPERVKGDPEITLFVKGFDKALGEIAVSTYLPPGKPMLLCVCYCACTKISVWRNRSRVEHSVTVI